MPYIKGIGSSKPKNHHFKNENFGSYISTVDNHLGDCAVVVRNVCKRFDKGPLVLQNCCMNVRKGTIYGLLGSSGCGKTTLLSCIVGLQQCDSGKVLVFGKKPGAIGSGIPGKKLGYMPQELALYNQLSIQEIIQFYGRIYGMPSQEITKRWDYLSSLLDLDNTFKTIGDLSGGQQRRASLALALIHSPELIVLDEPTVGLDPLLRKSIWDYLYTIVRNLGTAIIITTHYIEEARNSNTIGVMRNGRLIVEDTPFNLLRNYNCELIEQVVLQLCRKDERSQKKNLLNTQSSDQHQWKAHDVKSQPLSQWKQNSISDVIAVSEEYKLQSIHCDKYQLTKGQKECDERKDITENISFQERISVLFHTWRRIYGLTTVILLTLIRHPVFMGLIFYMPSIQGLLTLLSVAYIPTGLHFGIVNHELSNWTLECDLPVHTGNSCDANALSCKYLNQLRANHILILDSYNSESEALSQVHIGKIWGYLIFPDNYSQNTLDRFTALQYAWNESIEGSQLHARLDHSQFVQVSLIIKHLYASYLEYIERLATDCGTSDHQAELPLHFRPPVYGNDDDDYATFVIPGLMLLSIYALSCGLTGMIVVSDRKQGTLSRAHIAGLSIGDVLTSHLITQTVIAVVQIIIWLALLHFVFDFVSVGSTWITVLTCLMMALSGSAIGMFFGQICKESIQVLFIIIFLFCVFVFFGCVVFPMENMALFWRGICKILPTAIPTLSLRSVMVRGYGLTNPLVWSGLSIPVAWMIVFLIASVITYKQVNKEN